MRTIGMMQPREAKGRFDSPGSGQDSSGDHVTVGKKAGLQNALKRTGLKGSVRAASASLHPMHSGSSHKELLGKFRTAGYKVGQTDGRPPTQSTPIVGKRSSMTLHTNGKRHTLEHA